LKDSSGVHIRTTFTIFGAHLAARAKLNSAKLTLFLQSRWLPFDKARNYPDLGSRFAAGEKLAKENLLRKAQQAQAQKDGEHNVVRAPHHDHWQDEDSADLSWATVMKRTFEAFIRGERANMYGEWIKW
jgi:WD repeat and SOF domain-containing protein 1